LGHKCREEKIKSHKRLPSALSASRDALSLVRLSLANRTFGAIGIAAACVALILLPAAAQPQIDISQILRAGATDGAIRHRLRGRK
jgi:hypothetical protein